MDATEHLDGAPDADVPATLHSLTLRGDWERVGAILESLAPDQLTAAKTWYRSSGRRLARDVATGEIPDPDTGRTSRTGWLVRLALAIALAPTPRAAAKDAGFGAWWWYFEKTDDGGLVTRLLLAHDASWCADFLDAASSLRLRDESLSRFARLAMRLLEQRDVSLPAGESFLRGWALLAQRLAMGTPDPDFAHVGDLWGRTPQLADVLTALCALEDGLAPLESIPEGPHAVASLVRGLVADQPPARAQLLDAALRSLSRGGTRGSQRVALRILHGVDLTATDVSDHVPLVSHFLPTVHGEVTTMLLPLLLAVDLDPEDLLDIGSTILARKEKAQKLALLKHLAGLHGSGAIADVVSQLLSTAAESPDAAFADRARSLLAGRGEKVDEAAPIAVVVEWRKTSADGEPHAPSQDLAPLEAVDTSAAAIAALYSATIHRSTPTSGSRWLDVAVRFAARDVDGLRAALVDVPTVGSWSIQPPGYARLRAWALDGSALPGYDNSSGQWELDDRPPPEFSLGHAPHRVLSERLAAETVTRLGTVSQLLSTPSRSDATLTFADLVSRVRAAGPAGYGPLDLQIALLRLEPVPPGALSALEGVTLRPDPRVTPRLGALARLRGTTSLPDGVDVIRRWVLAGGIPSRPTEFRDGEVIAPATSLPLTLPGAEPLADLTATIHADPQTGYCNDFFDPHSMGAMLEMLPWWPDTLVAAAGLHHFGWHEPGHRPPWRTAARPLSLGVHVQLMTTLVENAEKRRLAGAAEISELADAGRLDPGLLRYAALALFERGDLPLARAASAIEHVILTGGLSSVWPTLAALADVAARAPRLPAGLADLVRSMQPYAAAAAPHHPLPDAVRELAARRGASKAILEVRALVAAADAAPEGTP